MKKYLRVLVNNRVTILAVLGASLYYFVENYQISLWYILLAGTAIGIIFGKVFCRWICPIGLIMELMMSISPDGKFRQMYQYHKLGCPIAWISGWLNKYSIFKINFKDDACKNCGLCDSKCYIVAMEPKKYSLYQTTKVNPGSNYACSKCLQCVAACPNDSLMYNVKQLK